MPTKPNKRGRDGNLPDKEFQIMIVKMIQNLENKMESQINSLETRIEKMQERFVEFSLLWSFLTVGGVVSVACQGFLVREACVGVLVGRAGFLLS